MSIKMRFLLSYIGVTVVSITLCLAAGFLILFTVTGDVGAIDHLFKKTYIQKPLTAKEESTFLDLKLLAKKDPNALLNINELQKMKQEDIGIVVRRSGKVFYTSDEQNRAKLERFLPKFEEININTRDTIRIDDTFYTYVKFDFYFEDGEQGSIFVLRKASSYAELTRELFPLLLLLLVILFVVIIGLLNYLVSRSIIKPITFLKHSADRIKSGDLNFKVTTASNDEVGQLYRAFEEMRIRLKESTELQIKYEENRKELLSNISHDLKTPITSIIGYVEGIRDGVANSPEKMDKYLSTISIKARDLDKLIDGLFLFSKLDLKRELFSFETVDLVQFIKEFSEEVQFDLQPQGIKLDVSIISQSIYVTADREKIKRVMMNVIQNSVKFLDKDEKKITIHLEERKDDAKISIKDNGQGIDPEAIPYVFDRFYRLEPSRNTETGGSGLGLAIAKQIILAHGGTIEADSLLGEETSVIFTLKKGEHRETHSAD
ncbi:sensor histidine kinase [Fictibacillus barbaricus]|uniref:histidine kinase n=1 Tax=Fictibacillus barbaricus TaxID=182136 RepID=A0ABS2ZC40_9BACL|nr:HAMP domain-containing sensor histidine kinase [Fictibacillus barbaricus]MBN3545001.1 HAMP domain-containing histidine kinase [Fictibacillus barbaricus]GGB62484.1 two-component sensor histidine kinase [Fictibacillus barbaricus]